MQSASWLTNMCQPEVFNTSAQPGLTRHGRFLSECESNLYCFKESLHIMSQGEGSTQGRMFLIKKKTFHASGKYANRGKKILPETPVMTPWQRKNLSTVGVYNMKAAEGLQNLFQIDTQLQRISAVFFFLEVFAPPFRADSMGPCSWMPRKSHPKRSSCLETFTPSNIMWSHSSDTVNGPLGHLGRENPIPSTAVWAHTVMGGSREKEIVLNKMSSASNPGF